MKNIIRTQENTLKNRKKELEQFQKFFDNNFNPSMKKWFEGIINKM